MAAITDTASLETKPINIQATGRRLIAGKAIAGKMIAMAIVRKTIAVMTTTGKTIAMMMIVGKAIVVISGSGMTMNDAGTVLTTDRLASTDKIAGSLATTRSGRPMPSTTKTMSSAPILAMIKMILILPPVCQSPPLTAMRLV